jgi:hypothetical protein
MGRPRSRRVKNIKMDLREIGWDGVDWIDLVHNRTQWRVLVNTGLNAHTDFDEEMYWKMCTWNSQKKMGVRC